MKSNPHKVVLITAPSGSGKSTLINKLLTEHQHFGISISATTRSPRGKEKEGKDYYYITSEQFKKDIEANAFLEWELVYEGLYYGTFRSEIDRILREGKTPILDIDVQGALSLRKEFGENALNVFIKVPNLEVLEERLKKRNTDSEEKIKERVMKAEEELTFENEFDVVIVNDELNIAYEELNQAIMKFLESNHSEL